MAERARLTGGWAEYRVVGLVTFGRDATRVYVGAVGRWFERNYTVETTWNEVATDPQYFRVKRWLVGAAPYRYKVTTRMFVRPGAGP